MENKLDYRLNEIKKPKKISQRACDYVRCPGSPLLCNPKVHEEGVPSRSTISTINSYNYKAVKILAKLLEDL